MTKEPIEGGFIQADLANLLVGEAGPYYIADIKTCLMELVDSLFDAVKLAKVALVGGYTA